MKPIRTYAGRLLVGSFLLLWGVMPAAAAKPSVAVQCPGDMNGDAVIDTVDPAHPNAKCMHLSASDGFVRMADNRRLYMFGFADVTGTPEKDVMGDAMLGGEFPAPTISLDEGDEFYLSVTNVGMMIRPDLFDPQTIHWHGFPDASAIFDGVPDASISINMGATLTYYYNVVEPGTYMYHCHVEALEHMQMGMLGNLYVRPAQNQLPDMADLDGAGPGTVLHATGNTYVYNDQDGSTLYDVEYPLQLGSFDPDFHDQSETVQPLAFANMTDKYAMINGRGYPDTINPGTFSNLADDPKHTQPVNSIITATVGEKVLLRISNLNVTRFYSIGTTGLPMRVVGRDAKLHRGPDPDGAGPLLGKDLSFETSSVNLGGGESVDVIIDTAGHAAGTYFLYTTNLNYLANNEEDLGGMLTEIVLN